jgi:hypothetical protein
VKRAMVAAAAAAIATGAVLVRGGGAETGPATIRITDIQTEYKRVDSGAAGRIGDVEVLRQQLYNRRISPRPIGSAYLVCTFLDRRARQCNGTYVLPKGKIVVAGALDSRLLYEAAIVGGTGLYDNARGALTVTATALRPRRNVLLFRLAG